MSIKKILLQASVVLTVILGAYSYGNCQPAEADKPTLVIFHSPACHYCVKVRQEIIPEIEKKYKGRVILEYRDVDNIEDYTLLLGLEEKYGVTVAGSMPIFYMRGHFINGYENIKSGWERFINSALEPSNKVKPVILPVVDLLSRFSRFTPALIMSVGFIDGLNPCAFTVIVFFMSFMALQGYRKRELIGIGLSFIFAVFVTYLLIGIGVFSFFYRLKRFWLLVKIINCSIGAFSIIIGILTVYDFFKFMKTRQTEGLILQLPKGIKDQIHKVIGLFGRVIKKSARATPGRGFSYRAIVSALVTGFLVSFLEAVCTGQAYIPTISFILKTSSLKLQAMGYLLLFNAMFVVPLLIIFIFTIFGVTSERFAKFFKKYILVIKMLMAVLFFGLGVFLIWKA